MLDGLEFLAEPYSLRFKRLSLELQLLDDITLVKMVFPHVQDAILGLLETLSVFLVLVGQTLEVLLLLENHVPHGNQNSLRLVDTGRAVHTGDSAL